MKRVIQKPNGCYAACIAMLTGVALDLVPHARKKELDQEHWHCYNNRMNRWLIKRGWFKVWLPPTFKPLGYSIIHGTGPRNFGHVCVAKNGTILHDPFPTGGGLSNIEGYEVLVRRAVK